MPILATNPLFPAVATESRIRWAGLVPEDFLLYTTYENSRHCKPNPDYYWDIMNNLGAKPEECIMVGNDFDEDIFNHSVYGIHIKLQNICLIYYMEILIIVMN